MKAYFLAKTHPEEYSIDDLKREGRTGWDGVSNAQAVNAIKTMKPGDRVLVYHSGGVSAVVGLAEVVSKPRQDESNPRSWVFEVEFRALVDPPLTLAEVKAEGRFSEWALVRQGRLSTMVVPAEFVDWMRKRYPELKL